MADNTTCVILVPLGDINWSFSHPNPLPASLGLFAIIGAFSALAFWSSISLTARLLFTFQHYRGLYFSSILITTWGLNIRAIGYLFKYALPTCPWILSTTLSDIGWVGMISGFSVILYSRLKILTQNRDVLRLVLAIIIVNGVCLHTATIATSYVLGVKRGEEPRKKAPWIAAEEKIERVQAVGFTVEQLIISSVYMKAAWNHLQDRFLTSPRARKVMIYLIIVQLLVIAIDVVVVTLDLVGYVVLKLIIHSFIYSIKLELEFAILNQLVALSQIGVQGLMSVSPDDSVTRLPDSSTISPALPVMVGMNEKSRSTSSQLNFDLAGPSASTSVE